MVIAVTGKSEKKPSCAKKLEESEAKAQEYLDMARRLQADFENLKKRTAKELDDFKKYATADMVNEILTVMDDLERALKHADQESELAKGVSAIHANLMKVLVSRGLSEIPTEGKFDPNCHEALCVCDGEEDGTIREVFQKGYRMGDRILRYSKVMVTKAKQEGEEQCQE